VELTRVSARAVAVISDLNMFYPFHQVSLL